MSNETKSDPLSRAVLISLLVVCVTAVGAVVFLVMQSSRKEPEKIISVMEAPPQSAPVVNVMDVVDTLTNASVVAAEGGRYKVLVVDEAREGSSGIARIGGLVTFVPDTQRGDLVVIEVTRLKKSTADAIVIEKLASGQPVPESRRTSSSPQVAHPDAGRMESDLVGKSFTGLVTDTGKEGDGIVKVDGKVVFVSGAVKGQRVEFRITEDIGRFARGEVVQVLPAAQESPSSAVPAHDAMDTEKKAAPVAVGDEIDVEVTEADRRNPDINGVARVDNFVVFVPGTRIGDKVRIRVTAVRARAADSEVIERPATSPAAP